MLPRVFLGYGSHDGPASAALLFDRHRNGGSETNETATVNRGEINRDDLFDPKAQKRRMIQDSGKGEKMRESEGDRN